jgi:hypothetical protein
VWPTLPAPVTKCSNRSANFDYLKNMFVKASEPPHKAIWAIRLLVLAALLVVCDFNHWGRSTIGRINPDSPFRSAFKMNIDPRDPKERQLILDKLPLGSSKPEIYAFIAKHFLDVEFEGAYPRFLNKQAPFIEITVISSSSNAGSSYVHISFFLDEKEKLGNVEVRGWGSYF